MSNQDVKFIRVNGRIIPIKAKNKQGISKVKLPAEKKGITETSGFKLSGLGSQLGVLGFGLGVGGTKAHSSALKGIMAATYPAESVKFEKIIKFARGAKKVGRKFELIGLGISGIGIGLGAYQYFRQK